MRLQNIFFSHLLGELVFGTTNSTTMHFVSLFISPVTELVESHSECYLPFLMFGIVLSDKGKRLFEDFKSHSILFGISISLSVIDLAILSH